MERQEAIARLTRRWNEECLRWPLMHRDIPLSLYIAVNIGVVRRHRQLSKYAS